MNIIFPSVDDTYIKAKVDDGFYANATELVRDAVRRLREEDDQKYNRLMAALEVGEKAIKEGRTKPYNAALLTRIEEQAKQHAAENRKSDPDVCA